MSRKPTRRDFLTGRLRPLIPGQSGAAELSTAWDASGAADHPALLVHVSRSAMACQFQIFLNAGQYPHGLSAALEALELLEVLEQQMSIFRPDSLIQQINRQAAFEPVVVEDRLFELLELADAISRLTEGAFDLTCTPLWEVWGFAQRQPRVPTQAELAQAQEQVGWQYVCLNSADRTIRFTRPGIQLNLGSIGKGYAVDRCAEVLRQAGIEHFLIHGGQSSALARGNRQDVAGSLGWPVGLRHPLRPQRRLGQFWLHDLALGTSGSGVQFFYSDGRRLAHIIDPRTGQPGGQDILSVTVLAPTAAEADALATGLFLLGVEKTRQLCQQRPDLGVLLILPDPPSGDVRVLALGMAQSLWHPSCPPGDP